MIFYISFSSVICSIVASILTLIPCHALVNTSLGASNNLIKSSWLSVILDNHNNLANITPQIFPEQSAIIAIGSQAKGGQLGIQNNTMIDFNRSLIDRITRR